MEHSSYTEEQSIMTAVVCLSQSLNKLVKITDVNVILVLNVFVPKTCYTIIYTPQGVIRTPGYIHN